MTGAGATQRGHTYPPPHGSWVASAPPSCTAVAELCTPHVRAHRSPCHRTTCHPAWTNFKNNNRAARRRGRRTIHKEEQDVGSENYSPGKAHRRQKARATRTGRSDERVCAGLRWRRHGSVPTTHQESSGVSRRAQDWCWIVKTRRLRVAAQHLCNIIGGTVGLPAATLPPCLPLAGTGAQIHAHLAAWLERVCACTQPTHGLLGSYGKAQKAG